MKTITAIAVAVGAMLGAICGAAAAKADEPFIMCPSGRSGVATSVTSCAFADNVRYNYIRQGGGTIIDAC